MRELVEALDGTWSATSAVLHGIGDHDWDRPTGCPGWSVKDQLSHLVWSAGIFLGLTPPDVELPPLAHVRSPVGEYMERDVEARRTLSGPDVLAEFDDARRRAVDDLRGRLPDGLDEPFTGPMGVEMPRSSYLPIAVFDQWVHGEDIRAALDVPGDLVSAAADVAFAQIGRAVTGIVDAPVLLELTGRGARTLACGEGTPVATITLPVADLVTMATGRARPTSVGDVEGDQAAASAALAVFPITP